MYPRACSSEIRLVLHRGSSLFCSVAVAILSAKAYADVRPSVKVTVPPEHRIPAQSGVEYVGRLDIHVGEEGELTDVAISGNGWQLEPISTGPVPLRRGEAFRLDYRGVPADESEPLQFLATFEGRKIQKTLDLSPAYFASAGKARGVVNIDAEGRITPFSPTLSFEPSNVAGGQQIRFRGRITYLRPATLNAAQTIVTGADGVWFEIMDDDSPDFDEVIYSGHTAPDGSFDVTVNWDDCDLIGCDRPDIYLRYETDTGVAAVQDAGVLEEDYDWSTDDHIIEDFPGGDVIFGAVSPDDMDSHGALHILTSVTRAHRFILANSGVSVEKVDVQWPDSGENSFYRPFFNEIHINANGTWNEGTQIHEYGHHYLELYSLNLTPDYCNGFCDNNGCNVGECDPLDPFDNGGHCLWCQENNHDAWNEGFPNWLGSAVMRTYPETPTSVNDDRYTLEQLDECCQDGSFHPADITEGFLAALLRDIEDDNLSSDDHSGGTYDCVGSPSTLDCERDSLALGADEILEVARLHQVTNPLEFVEKFVLQFPEHAQDFWSTANNVSPLYSFNPPPPQITEQSQACRMNIAGQPLALSVQTSGQSLRYRWTRSGVDVLDNAQISGSRCSTLNLNPLTAAHAGTYQVNVTTCDFSQTTPSDPIRVTVFPQRGAGTPAAGFGANNLGQLGNSIVGPDTYVFPRPTPLAGLSDVVQVSSADFASLALRSDGTVWAWGIRRFGPNSGLGQFTTTPEQVPGLTEVVQVAAGGMWGWGHNLALKADGTVWGWGANGSGELGMGDFNGRQFPTQVPIDCVIAIAAGAQFSLFLKSAGTVWSAGRNSNGQLGRSTGGPFVPEIDQVEFVNSVTAIAAGGDHSLALHSDGTVSSWGRNGEGQLGRGLNFEWTSVASPVFGLSNVSFITAGGSHSIAILNDQSARTWGANTWGQLGNGGSPNQLSPVQPIGLGAVRDAAGGANHSAFVATNGTLWTVGSNHYGEGGHRSGAQYIPVQVPQISNVLDVEAGDGQTFILNDGVPPSIIVHPVSRTVLVGHSVEFGVTLLSLPAPHFFQWRREGAMLSDGGAISGANTSTLRLDPVTKEMIGGYTIDVTNTFGFDVSLPATLTVLCANGDANCDGRVDAEDGAQLAECINGPFGPRPIECVPAEFGIFDANNDGDVDLRDAAVFLNCFAGLEVIPEACGF